MSISKRVTFLKGMVEGLSLGNSTKEEKVIHMIIDILGDISAEIDEISEGVTNLDDDITALTEEVKELEDSLQVDEGSCGCGDHHGHHHHHHDKGSSPNFYAVRCPSCQNEITIDEDVLKLGAIDCPSCSEKLELDMDEPA